MSIAERASAVVDGRRFEVGQDRPLVFGRADSGEEVVGRDMGVSAVAGAVECLWGVWWVHNPSGKCFLLLADGSGGAPRRLHCGDRHAISSDRLVVLVPGEVLTHRIVVEVPSSYVERLRNVSPIGSGTVTANDVALSERDSDALVAFLAGYLEPFPRYYHHPSTYAEAAGRLGEPWDHNQAANRSNVSAAAWPPSASMSTAPEPTTTSRSS